MAAGIESTYLAPRVLTAASASSPAVSGRAGLWLDQDQLLALPLEADARAQLWRLALAQQVQLPLLVALARHCGQASTAAAADGQWGLMQEQMEEAVRLYQQLTQLDPQRAPAARQELGNLIGKLLSDLHASVHAEQPPPPVARGQLCWRGFQLGRLYRQLELEWPDWLWHLEEQLVREGAIGLRELSRQGPPDLDAGEASSAALMLRWRGQALELLLHLGRLHQPCPEWILQAAQELIALEVERALEAGPERAAPADLQQLFAALARLPLPVEQLATVQLAAQRGIWSLQLLEQSSDRSLGSEPAAPRATPAAAATSAAVSSAASPGASRPGTTKPRGGAFPEAPAETQRAAPETSHRRSPEVAPQRHSAGPPRPPLQPSAPQEVAAPRDPRQLYRALGLGVADWLADHPAGLGTTRLEPVFRAGQKPVLRTEGVLQLNLAALLAFPSVELLDQLMPAFFTPLREAGRGVELQLAEPHSALWNELCGLWAGGASLAPEQMRALVYSAALWNTCGGPSGLAAAALPWSLPVAQLEHGQSLLRPGNVELAALQTVLLQSEGLEDLLAEIRRRHHDRAWMEQQRDAWWYDPTDGSENLRRLHTNAGFYASSHAPLESLQRWGQSTLRALLSSSVLFGNASITSMFWPVAQHIGRRVGALPALVQWPGDQSFYQFIGGQEVLFVTPLAAEVEAHHRTGLAFSLFKDIRIDPYGLRCIEAPMSIYPNRPDRGFEDSLDRALEQVDRAFRQKPFSVFTAACGAYGLPLCEAVKQRYGVSCVYVGNLMHAYFGVLQRTTSEWRRDSRIQEHWVVSRSLEGVPGVDRVEGGRYLG